MLRRRSKRTSFEGYVSPETSAKLLREGKPGIQPPQVRHFQFVVILVDDANPNDVPTMIETVTGTLVRQHATVLNIASALLVGLLGVPFPESNSPQARLELVAAILQDNGARVRVAHGECDGAVGMFGGHQRWT
jgi:hypothetical protein